MTVNTNIFRDYMSTRKPSAKQKEIVELIVNFYIPAYFHVKTHPTLSKMGRPTCSSCSPFPGT